MYVVRSIPTPSRVVEPAVATRLDCSVLKRYMAAGFAVIVVAIAVLVVVVVAVVVVAAHLTLIQAGSFESIESRSVNQKLSIF